MTRRTGALAAAAIVAAAAGLAAAGAGEDRPPRFPEGPPDLDRFLFFATLEGLREDRLPDAAVEKVLEKDGNGRYRNFVYACPICTPVVEGFRAWALRREISYARKGDAWLGDGRVADGAADLAARIAGDGARARGAALQEFVDRCVERRCERLRLTEEEIAWWRTRFADGRKKGMSVLRDSEGFAHESCPSCDGANGNAAPWK
jgi:hypothetical protein